MAVKLKKILSVTIKTILIVIAVILVTISIVINFIFTPDYVTPRVVDAANEFIRGDFHTERVELTFFSTFPDLTAALGTTRIVTDEGDTLVFFGEAEVGLNPVSILQGNDIKVDHILLNELVVNALVDEEGIANWDISLPATDTTTVETTTDEEPLSFTIERMDIVKAHLAYDDLAAGMSANINNLDFGGAMDYGEDGQIDLSIEAIDMEQLLFSMNDSATSLQTRLDQFNFTGDVTYVEDQAMMDIKLGIDELLVNMTGQPTLNPREIQLIARTAVDIAQTEVTIDTLAFSASNPGISLTTQGRWSQDTTGVMDMDLNNKLYISDIGEFLALVPPETFKSDEYKARGAVDINALVAGIYDEENLPSVDARMDVRKAYLSHEGYPNAVDLFETSIDTKMDFTGRTSSFVNINKLVVESAGLHLSTNGTVTDALANAHIDLQSKGDVNFGELLVAIPYEDIDARGTVDFDVAYDLYLKDLENFNYGKINASGNLDLKNIYANYKNDSVVFATSRSIIDLGQKQKTTDEGDDESRLLRGDFRLNNLNIGIEDQARFNADVLNVALRTSLAEDTAQISPVKADFAMKQSNFNLGDTLNGKLANIEGNLQMRSTKKAPDVPVIKSELSVDDARIESGESYAELKSLDYQFQTEKRANGRWPTYGHFEFSRLEAFDPSFPTKIYLRKTYVDVLPRVFTLSRSTMRIGKSTVTLKGKIFNLQNTIAKQNAFKADLTVRSKYLDINELTHIINQGATFEEIHDMAAIDTTSQENDALETFVVPKNVDVTMKVNLNKVHYGDLELSKVRGDVVVKDQTVWLNKLRMKTNAADVRTTAKYEARSTDRAHANFDLSLTNLDIANMIRVLPFLDTLLPMAKDFEGLVNMGMIGHANIGENMAIDQSSLEAVARLEGQDVVLLDNETFDYMAKALKFKNRDKNHLDTLLVEMAIEDGTVEIFPSLVRMDRYRVAVGGQQNLDLTYKYHVSVLKSPLPFKTGIDIKGNAEDYDYKITKAKYKYLFSSKGKHKNKVDTALVNKREAILKKISFD